MFRTKWMLIHGLDSTKNHVLDIYIKEIAIKICLPEEFVWQTYYEAALHNKSRLYQSFFHRVLTLAFRSVVGEKNFKKMLSEADEKLDKLREEALNSMVHLVDLREDDDRSKAN